MQQTGDSVISCIVLSLAAANTQDTIQFFSSPQSTGQGETYLGQITVRTNRLGSASFSASSLPLALGQIITATATDSNGNTSKFSNGLKERFPIIIKVPGRAL